MSQTVALAEFVARCAYVALELFILCLFLYIFRFFVRLKLELIQEEYENGRFSNFQKVIIGIVITIAFVNFEFCISSFIYSVLEWKDLGIGTFTDDEI